MSHFSVLVIGEDIEGLLAPYDENLDVEPYIDKSASDIQAEFDELKNEYMANPEKSNGFRTLTLSLNSPNAEWVKEYSGGELDDDGNVLCTYNSDRKWDWYEIGGRWTGMLRLKSGRKGINGSPGVFDQDRVSDPKYCDQCRIKDVNWKYMNNQARKDAGATWDDMMNPEPGTSIYKPEYIAEQKNLHLKLYKTRNEYINRRGFWTTYALLTEDEWYEPGEMGWFGISSATVDTRDKYEHEFVKIIKSYQKDTLITVVDCHI